MSVHHLLESLDPIAGSSRREGSLAAVPRRSRLDLVEVVTWSRRQLEGAMRSARAPDPDQLTYWEWSGYNVPYFTQALGFRKFKKGFYPAGDMVQGYNVRIKSEGGPLDPWIPVRGADGEEIHHGLFDVIAPTSPDDAYPNGLLITYDCGRNPTWDPSARLRDYLVSLGPDTLLGKAYVALGSLRVPVSYFVLQRSSRL